MYHLYHLCGETVPEIPQPGDRSVSGSGGGEKAAVQGAVWGTVPDGSGLFSCGDRPGLCAGVHCAEDLPGAFSV